MITSCCYETEIYRDIFERERCSGISKTLPDYIDGFALSLEFYSTGSLIWMVMMCFFTGHYCAAQIIVPFKSRLKNQLRSNVQRIFVKYQCGEVAKIMPY